MGLQMAKTLSWLLNKPLISIHHLAGHIYSGAIDHNLEYPLLSLVVSGGHTQLILVDQEMSFEILGDTQDDAVGECFDKVARVLGLGYPGGKAIDKLALRGENLFSFIIIFPIQD